MNLLEMTISWFILGCILCCSLPFIYNFYQTNRLNIVAAEITDAIYFAKTQALIHNTPLMLVSLTATNDWSAGMRLVDNNLNSASLHEWHWHINGLTIIWHGFQSQRMLRFAQQLHFSAMNGVFILQNRTHKGLTLTVNRLGRVRRNYAFRELTINNIPNNISSCH